MFERVSTLGTETTLVETRNFSELATAIAEANGLSVFFCNVHMLMLSNEDASLAEAMGKADIVFADGVPIAWLQRKIYCRPAKVIRGYEMMLAICERAAKSGENVGFIGSTETVMDNLVRVLSERFDGLQVTFRVCPPFTTDEIISTPLELQDIKLSEVKWLFVGLGCPKQEKWIARYQQDLNCNILGVGAAFDWLSGEVKKPPDWMEKYALAWLYRFAQNPARMGHRYLKYNSKFIWKALPVLFGKK